MHVHHYMFFSGNMYCVTQIEDQQLFTVSFDLLAPLAAMSFDQSQTQLCGQHKQLKTCPL